jgi:hypothetical protein
MDRSLFILTILLVVPNAARADDLAPTSIDSALTFHPTYIRAPFDLQLRTPAPGESVGIEIVGLVSEAMAPIQGLPLAQAGVEVTFTITDLDYVTAVLWDSEDLEYGGLSYEFSDGWFRVYADDSPDANPSEPSSFRDGDVLLEGLVRSYYTGLQDCYYCPGKNDGFIEFTGGSLFSEVSENGVGYQALFIHYPETAPEILLSSGYQYVGDGNLTLYIPVAAVSTTWGQLKAKYR